MTTRHTLIFLSILLVAGCGKSGPASTKTNSSGIATTAERVNFLQEYVTFRRTYESLDFNIFYQNNGGGMSPGPSDWDVQIVATVPASELQAWVPPGVKSGPPPALDWLKSVPTTLDLSGINEWYTDGHRIVGLDRTRRIVVYRQATM